jgi:DNA-binding transcriptional LysR family regulator
MVPDLDLALLKTFAAIVDEGGLTAAGKVVGRTQPAITHQLRRLERLVGQKLIVVGRRNLTLTHDGEILLQFARQMLRLNDEARARMSAPDIEGRVIFGVPDLYASILPDILRSFGHAYPRIEIELRCTRSVHLHAALKRKEIDLALVTRLPKVEGGRFVGQQPLIWVSGLRNHPEMVDPLPLALLPIGAISRQFALDALEELGRPWRIISVSDSITGLQAAIFAGLAVTVLPQCAVTPGMRVLAVRANLPMLRAADLHIHHRAGPISPAAASLGEFIAQRLNSTPGFQPRRSPPRKARA